VPRGLAIPVGMTANAVHRVWRQISTSKAGIGRIEVLTRFEETVDAVVHQNAGSGRSGPGRYWCVRDAAFLNWRYFEHPLFSYVALGLYHGDALTGFCVVRTNGSKAMLMELGVADGALKGAGVLVNAAMRTARAAGCNQLDTYATESWQFWPLLRRMGFVSRPSNVFVTGRQTGHDEAAREHCWTLVPGDSDVT
jgi:hypothetical protein